MDNEIPFAGSTLEKKLKEHTEALQRGDCHLKLQRIKPDGKKVKVTIGKKFYKKFTLKNRR